MSRAETLSFVLSVLHALLGGLCLATSRGDREYPALRFWGWGLLAYALGVLPGLLPALPPIATSVVGGALVAVAPAFCVRGVMLHTRIRLRQRWQGAALLASVLPAFISPLLPAPLVIDAVTPTPAAIALMVVAAWAMWRHTNGRTVAPARLVAVALAAAALAWTLRIAMVWPADAASSPARADRLIIVFTLTQMAAVTAASFGLFWIETRKLEAAVDKFANVDTLTGLPNRRAAHLRYKEEMARATRHERTFALVLLDVDRFKQILDMRGTLAGDAVVRHVADTLRAAVRGEDALSRVGPEGFMLLLPEQESDGAAATADRLCDLVAAKPCRYDAWPLNLTMSNGVAVYPVDGRDWETLFSIASRRLEASRGHGQGMRVERRG